MPAERVLYCPPWRSPRAGTIRAVSGQSALITFDDCDWPQWAPLARLLPLLSFTDGYEQIALFAESEDTP